MPPPSEGSIFQHPDMIAVFESIKQQNKEKTDYKNNEDEGERSSREFLSSILKQLHDKRGREEKPYIDPVRQ